MIFVEDVDRGHNQTDYLVRLTKTDVRLLEMLLTFYGPFLKVQRGPKLMLDGKEISKPYSTLKRGINYLVKHIIEED